MFKKRLLSIGEEINDNANSISMVDKLTRDKKLEDKSRANS